MNQQKKSRHTSCAIMAAIALAFIFGLGLIAMFFLGKAKDVLPAFNVSDATNVYMTPTQIRQIRDIGQWEFMTIKDEELADTTREGIFFDDHLVRIYYGTLRLGIDLSRLDSTNIITQGDILLLHLPDVCLLDEDFIDEARTRSFHESGTWSNQDRQELYERARQRMKARCITPEALSTTRQQAEAHISQMLQAMGFEKTVIDFNAPQPNND